MGLRLKIIMNPSSGREKAKLNIEGMLSFLTDYKALERADLNCTSGKGDATRFAMSVKGHEDEYDIIIAAGGDGTVNEVVSGMIQAGITLPLAIYTSGTVNDFATFNGLPTNPSDFARMLMYPEIKNVDVGKCGDSYFMNVLCGGLMSDVAYKVPSDLKTDFGPVAYWMSGIKDIPAMTNTYNLTFEANGQTYEAETIMFFVSNSKSVGGFKKLMIGADLNDGVLDVLVVPKMEITDVLPLLGKLAIGEHVNSDKIIYFQTDKLTITSKDEEPFVLDIDGEKGPELPAVIECLHSAIKIVTPGEEALL